MTYIEASNNQWKQEDKNEARKQTNKPSNQATHVLPQRRLKKNEEELDLSHVLPTQELTSGRRSYHFSSYTMSY